MSKAVKSILYWLPRILGILFFLFVMMFSLDVFGMGGGFWETALAFLIHSIPALFLLGFLLIGWQWEWVAAAGFLLFAAWYLVFAFGVDMLAYLLLGGLPLLIGALFLVGWVLRRKIRG